MQRPRLDRHVARARDHAHRAGRRVLIGAALAVAIRAAWVAAARIARILAPIAFAQPDRLHRLVDQRGRRDRHIPGDRLDRASLVGDSATGRDVDVALGNDDSDEVARARLAQGNPIYVTTPDTPKSLVEKRVPDGRRQFVRFDLQGEHVVVHVQTVSGL